MILFQNFCYIITVEELFLQSEVQNLHHACSGATYSGQEHDAKGIRYQKSGFDQVQMSWTQVAQRIDSLMKKGRYLTVEEEAERQEIEDAKTDPLEDVYDRFAVIDTEDGEYAIWDNQTDDYYVDHEGVTEYFTDEWPKMLQYQHCHR